MAGCEYTTERLRVGSWQWVAGEYGLDLPTEVTRVLTSRTTAALPGPWHGDFDDDRAKEWIAQRDAESPTLLALEVESGRCVGLVIIAELPLAPSGIDIRIGYVLAEEAWGRGIATELVEGLVEWARGHPSVHRLSAGVEVTNRASVRVLDKAGFERTDAQATGTATYELDVSTH